MNEYHKIQSVYKRGDKGKFIIGEWSTPELAYLKDNVWTWDEKIDGTNIRIGWDGTNVEIGGRTARAQIPPFLLERLTELFTMETLKEAFPEVQPDTQIVLYGEGYGNKIQKVGSLYIPDGNDFILFDVRVGKWWLRKEDVDGIASKLNIKSTTLVGKGTIQEAIDFVFKGFMSRVGNLPAEGLILRPEVDLFARNGGRIITKIKHKDFNK